MATAPLMAVLMLGHLGFAPWQYGLAFAAPCVGGLIGSRLSRPARRAVRAAPGAARRRARCARAGRSAWRSSVPAPAGLVLVMAVQFGLVTCMGVFNPVFATYRLEHDPGGPRRPHAVRLVGRQQRHDRGADRRCGACWPASPARAPRSRRPASSCWRPRSCSRGSARVERARHVGEERQDRLELHDLPRPYHRTVRPPERPAAPVRAACRRDGWRECGWPARRAFRDPTSRGTSPRRDR